jgi:hypothetical protein
VHGRRHDHDDDQAPDLDSIMAEHVQIDERLVLSPELGRFHWRTEATHAAQGDYIVEGHLVGEVRTPGGGVVPIPATFRGRLMGFLVPEGCPVKKSEPVAWLSPT